MKGIIKDGRYAKSEWAGITIKQMIACQIYLGHMEQGREHSRLYEGGGQRKKIDKSEWTIVYNTHEAIISQDLFDRANAVI
jgi:hypothetical protein